MSDNEDKLDNLRRENESVTEKLNELQMQDADQDANCEVTNGRSTNPEIHHLHIKIQAAQKLYEKTTDMNKKVELTNQNVRDWLSRIIKRIDQQFGEKIGSYSEEEKTMSFRFEKVLQALIKRLDQIVLEDADEERGFVTSKDFMNDFATEEFLNKNIRVEPTQGTKGAGEDDNKTQDGQPGAAAVSRHDAFGHNIDEDDNKHQLPFELRNEREQIKKRFEDYTQ